MFSSQLAYRCCRKPLRLSAPPDLQNRRLLQANSEVDKGKTGFRGALRATLYLAQYALTSGPVIQPKLVHSLLRYITGDICKMYLFVPKGA